MPARNTPDRAPAGMGSVDISLLLQIARAGLSFQQHIVGESSTAPVMPVLLRNHSSETSLQPSETSTT
jgi:hypothetical protein